MNERESLAPPTIEAFRALVALDQEKTVTAAARRLGYDQSAITRRLRTFQQGDAFLRRRGKHLELTPRGRASLPAIRQLVEQFDLVLRQCWRQSPLAQRLTIGTGSFFAERFLAGALSRMQPRLPGWQLQVRIIRGQRRILQTAEGTLDLAIVSHSPLQIQSLLNSSFGGAVELEIEPLCNFGLCVVALRNTAAGQGLAATSDKRPLNLNLLTRWPLAAPDPESGVRRQLEAALADDARGLSFAVEGGNWRTTLQFALAGLGMALVPAPLAADCNPRTTVTRRLSDALQIHYQLICLASNKPRERECLKQELFAACERA
ncbi:MAG: LysR family transcriptional regulator [Pirellulales bacterium]|nr:LysR family transcriptional regulator [Pirellulales bacterium]